MPRAEGQRRWIRDEFIAVLNLYLQLPFGKLDKKTTEVQELAIKLNRTPSSIAFVLTAFAGVDPFHIKRGIKGTTGSQKQCEPIFNEFINNPEELLFESQRVLAERENTTIEQKFETILKDLDLSDKKGEYRIREVKTRVNQHLFRRIVLNNFNNRCAITGIDQEDLLRASHIIPWAENEKERLNPQNGVCLSPLYDAAFDKFLISFDREYRVIISPLLKKQSDKDFYQSFFGKFENQEILKPNKYLLNIDFLKWHFDKIKV